MNTVDYRIRKSALAFLNSSDAFSAEREFTRLLAERNEPIDFAWRSFCRMLLGQFTGARADIENALAVLPDDRFCQLLWAHLVAGSDNPSQSNLILALSRIQNASDRPPNKDIPLLTIAGAVQSRLGNFRAAINCLKVAIESSGENERPFLISQLERYIKNLPYELNQQNIVEMFEHRNIACSNCGKPGLVQIPVDLGGGYCCLDCACS